MKVQRQLGSLDHENRNFPTGGERQARNAERICQIFMGKGWFGIHLKDWCSGRLKQYLIQLLLAATETDTSPVQSASRQLTAALDTERRARGRALKMRSCCTAVGLGIRVANEEAQIMFVACFDTAGNTLTVHIRSECSGGEGVRCVSAA